MHLPENFFHFFNHTRPPPAINKLMSIPLAKCPSMQESATGLSTQLKDIFHAIFTEDEPKQINLKNILPFKQHKTPMPVCNKLLGGNQFVFRCYECTTHESAVLCLSCFERGNHKGHRFTKMQSGGGNCDCGNPDAIAPQGFCVDHKGTADQMIISEQEDNNFSNYIRQLFIWILKLYQLQLKKQSQNLLVNLIQFLDSLNNESLFYNTLTNKLLFSGENQIIDHILYLGATSRDTPLAKKATQLFLKMFSLQVFKQNISMAYLRAYNRINNFESTKFQQLFIQLFANNDLVEKIITKTGLSLDPRDRQYDDISYYSNLIFMGTIKERAARMFFTPIIEKGGIHCKLIQNIQKRCEMGNKKIDEIYPQNLNNENLYYAVNKVLIRLIKDHPKLLQRQIQNQYTLVMKYSYNKNKIVLVHPRVFVMLMFICCECDLQRIDIAKIRDILKISHAEVRELLVKLTKCFLFCLKEYARCVGNIGFPRDDFDNYVNLYCRAGNIVINLDMLGIKFCAIAFQQINQSNCFHQTILQMYSGEKQKEGEIWESDEQQNEQQDEQPVASKQKQKNIVFYLGWLNTISFLAEAVLFERAQVNLGIDLQFKNSSALRQMQDNQFKRLLLNTREVSLSEMQAIGLYWFSKKDINKELVNKYTVFDRTRKKFVIKEDVKGIPIKRELLKSFAKTPEYYLKSSDQSVVMEITDKVRRFRQALLPTSTLRTIYKRLLSHLKMNLKEEFEKYLKEMANHLKIINMLFQYDNQVIQDIIDVVITMAQSSQKLKAEIVSMFQEEKKETMEEEVDKEKNQKRKQLLKKKKQEKLKLFKNKVNVQQFLQPNEKEDNANQLQSCIICHQRNSQSPLYYMASTFLSNILYSALHVDGINPFFLSCFHQVHYQCYISISKEKSKISCPLCKAFTNILIPTQETITNAKVLENVFERMQVILAIENKRQYQNLYVEIMKSFVQLFFSQAIQEGLISARQIKLFKILFQSVKTYFNKLSEQQKDKFCNSLRKVSLLYQKQSKISYNLGLFMDFIFQLSIKLLKNQQITQQYINQLVHHCKEIPHSDIKKCFLLAHKLFALNSTINIDNQSKMQEEGKQLQSFIHIFDPPKTIRSLLEQRKNIDNQNICKQGHNICICLICAWKGCFDCHQCSVHTRQAHNEDAIYFNFLTGGFYHQYNKICISIRSLYVNELGISWKPSDKEDNYYFEIDIYKKMVQAIKSGNLIQMIRSNYEELAVQTNSWSV